LKSTSRTGRKYPTEQRRKWHFRQRYGLAFGDYEKLLEQQNYCCAICDKPHGETKGTRLYVDHNHTTGTVRALLCAGCNTIVGSLEDSRLEKALNYIRKYNGTN
jgi:hypothetical protein